MNEIISIFIDLIGNIIAFVFPIMIIVVCTILVILKRRGKTFTGKNKNTKDKK